MKYRYYYHHLANEKIKIKTDYIVAKVMLARNWQG